MMKAVKATTFKVSGSLRHPLLTDQSLGYSNGYLGNVYSRCLAIACTLPHASKLGSIGTPKVVDGTTQGVALDRVSSLCIVR